MNLIKIDDKKFGKLKRKLIESKKIFQFVYSSVYPEVYSFVEKGGLDMRYNIHLKFKEWKDRKIYSLKSNQRYFYKVQNSLPPSGAIEKKLVSNEDFEEEKKIVEEHKQNEIEKKKTKKRSVDLKLRQKTRNLSE